jgi:hypothetical protein
MLLCLTISSMKNGDINLWYGCLSSFLLVKFSEDCHHISTAIKNWAWYGMTFTHWPWNYKSAALGIPMKRNQQRLHSAELTNHSSSTSTVLPHGCLCVLWHKLPGDTCHGEQSFCCVQAHHSSVCCALLFPLILILKELTLLLITRVIMQQFKLCEFMLLYIIHEKFIVTQVAYCMEQSRYGEDNNHSGGWEFSCFLWNPEFYYCVHKNLPVRQMNAVCVMFQYCFNIYFNIAFTLLKSPKYSLYFHFSG